MSDSLLTAVSTYGAAGSSARVRILDWLAHLRLPARMLDYAGTADNSLGSLASRPGHLVAAEFKLRVVEARKSQSGAVIISRSASPFSNGRLEAALLKSWEHSVYDFDDALFDSPEHGASKLWSKRRVWERAVPNADVVIAGSDYLAERASRFSANVVMIPSCVNPDSYELKTDYSIQSAYPTAVWLGSPSTEQYLQRISEPLLTLHRTRALRLKVISAGDRSLGALDQMVDRVAWSRDGFPGHLAGADVGIMPLPDEPYARGKCAYKLLQYGAAGLPVVASPVGANELALRRMGGVAATDGGWREALDSLLRATAYERRAAGVRARAAVVENYSFDAWASAWQSTVMQNRTRSSDSDPRGQVS